MSIGLVVDGQAESQALKLLIRRIVIPNNQLLGPFFANMQPKSTAAQIARSAATRLDFLQTRGVDLTVVLIDREDREECPGDWAQQITTAFNNSGFENVVTVVKNRAFENWLVSDVDTLAGLANFQVSNTVRRMIEPNKADNRADAAALLSRMKLNGSYQKGSDPHIITRRQDVLRIASNSRSFRRFLHVIGHENYQDQSRFPC